MRGSNGLKANGGHAVLTSDPFGARPGPAAGRDAILLRLIEEQAAGPSPRPKQPGLY